MSEFSERLKDIEAKWLNQCGACDAMLPMSCTCPEGDYRPDMFWLTTELRKAHELLDDIDIRPDE